MTVREIPRADLAWIAALTAIGAALRVSCLQQPISYDEAFTFLNYVAPGGTHVFDYTNPNNHVFHNILVRASTVAFGHELWTMRLPSFVGGTAAIPLTFLLCRQLTGRASGYLAATATSLYPYLVMYSALARGYSILTALSLLSALAGVRMIDHPSVGKCLLLVAAGALGLFTVPTMVVALAGEYLWLTAVVITRDRRRPLVGLIGLCGLSTAALTGLLYLPTIERAGLRAITANQVVQSLPWNAFIAALPAHFHETVRYFSFEIPASAFAIGAALIVIGVVDGLRRREWPVVFLVPALAAGAAAVLILKQSIPVARQWIFVIPFGLVAADIGLTAILRSTPRFARVALAACCIAVAGWTARAMAITHTITDAADFTAGPALVQQLKSVMRDGDAVYVMLPIDYPAYYYFWYYHVPSLPAQPGRGRSDFFIVDKHSYSLKDMTSAPATLIADYPYAALYERRAEPAR